MSLKWFVFACLLGSAAFASANEFAVLYDAEAGNQKPDSLAWQWLYGSSSPTGASATVTPPSAGAPYTTLDTSTNADISAGWGRISPFTLNKASGFIARFELQLLSSGIGNDRAGFSVMLLDFDRYGVEIGMGTNRLFAYNDDDAFTPGEGVDLDLTQMHQYELKIGNGSYFMSIDGKFVLGGSWRLYNQSLPPYNTPNFIFVGDDTSRQSSVARFKSFSIESVPEPATFAVFGLGVLAARLRRR